MKRLKTERFKLSVTLSIVSAIFIVFVLVVLSVTNSQEEYRQKQLKEYTTQVDSSIEHIINHFVKDYKYRVLRITETTNMSEMVKKRDREGLYKLLKAKFTLMQEETNNFQVMHIHLSDGTSLLRVHQPDKYGDKIADRRAMLREIHKNHKSIVGYETGNHATVYRIISPILDKDGTYLGAFEVGVNPNFIIEAVNDINGFCGMVFITESDLRLYSKPNKIVVDGYRLQSELTPQLKRICKAYKAPKKLENNIEISVGDIQYITHLITLKNFAGDDSVKIVFFQNITKGSLLFNNTQYMIYIFMFIVLVLMTWYVYHRISSYQKDVSNIYEEQISEIESTKNKLAFNQDYLQSVFNVIPNIMITTDGREIDEANPAMLEFFNYETIEEFKKEHDCVCDFFIGDNDCLEAEIDGSHWLEYILEREDELHKVCMNRGSKRYHFVVKAHTLDIDDKKRSVVVFNDVTDLEDLGSRLEYAIKGSSDGLWDWNIETDDLFFAPKWKEMLGYRDDELENSLATWKERVHPDDLEMALGEIEKSHIDPTHVFNFVHRLRHKDGHWVWILDRGQTIFNEDGKAVRMIGFHTDISEQKEDARRIEELGGLLKNTISSVQNLIFVKDSEFRYLECNSAFEEFIGIPRDKLLGRSDYDLFDKEIAGFFRAKDEEMLASHKTQENFEWVTYPDGREVYLFTSKSPLRDSNGKVIGLVGNSVDFTEHKRLETQLVENEQVYLDFFENSKSANIIYTTEDDGETFRIKNLNSSVEELEQVKKYDVIGKKVDEVFEGAEEFGIADVLKKVYKEGKSQKMPLSFYEDKKLLGWRENYIFKLSNGDIVASYEDRTQEKKLEVELRSSQHQFEQFMEYLPANVMIKDENHKIIYANKRASEFFKQEDIVGKGTKELLPPYLVDTVDKIDEEILKNGTHEELLELQDDNGNKLVYRNLGFKIVDDDIVKIGIVSIDITNEYQLKEDLFVQEELMIAQSRHAAMGEMISMIAHQWRQPISVIAMDANNILADIELEMVEEKSLRSTSEDIITQTQELSKTIDDFRNFFRPEKDAQEVIVKELFDDALGVIGKSLDNNQIAFILNLDENKKITTYTRELMQVFINIIKNAKEALIEKKIENKKITVYTSEDEENLKLRICDNAGGINEEIMEKIFNPYFSTKGEKNGTGLGLYMSKTIVDKHLQGSLTVENDDEGACFEIVVPHVIKES